MGDALGKVITAIVAIIALCVIAVTALLIAGRDPSILVAFIGGTVSGVIPSLFAILRVEHVNAAVKEIDTKVNGQMTKLVDKIPNGQ